MTTIDLQTVPMDQLALHYNSLVAKALAAGGDSTVYRPIRRFSDRSAGVKRVTTLETIIANKEIKVRNAKNPNEPATHPPGATNGSAEPDAPKAARAPRAPIVRDPNAPPTIHDLTKQFNALVEENSSLTLPGWAKVHTSDFASRDGANKQLDRLRNEIEKAKQPKPAEPAAGEQAQA